MGMTRLGFGLGGCIELYIKWFLLLQLNWFKGQTLTSFLRHTPQ